MIGEAGGQRCDGRIRRFNVRRQTEVVERARGDRADGRADDLCGQGQPGCVEQGDEVGGCGSAGEGDRVGISGGIAEEGSDGLERRVGDAIAVGRDDGDFGAGRDEMVAEDRRSGFGEDE